MSKRIIICALVLLLLSACSNQRPLAEAEIAAPVTDTDILPTAEISAHESESQADVSKSTDFASPEVPAYAAIVGYYRDFMQRNEATDIENKINSLYDNIALETRLKDEQKEYELWCSCAEALSGNLEYAIHDINGDRIPELLILSEDYFIHAIYSLHDDLPVLIGGYWARHRCAVDNEGVLYISSSGGAADSYSASYLLTSDNELQLIEMIGVESYDEQSGTSLPEPRYYRILNGSKTIIDDKEADIIWSNFPDTYPNNPTENVGLTIVPLSD